MKKIIKGKVYDTDTAIRLATWESDMDYRSMSHVNEVLYRKKTGEFFLHGVGGAMTKYAEPIGQNSWSGGSRIMPLGYAEAQSWAEEHLSGEEYEEIFGTVVEDDSKTSATFRLPVSTLENLKREASRNGLGVSEFLESVLESVLAQNPR